MALPVLRPTAKQRPATIDEVFDRLMEWPWGNGFGPVTLAPEEPAVDVYQEDGKVVVKAALPGAKADEVHLSVEGDVLTLRREYKEEKEEKRRTYHCREQRYGSFVREIALPQAVEADEATAELKDGILTITAPTAPMVGKQIAIKSS